MHCMLQMSTAPGMVLAEGCAAGDGLVQATDDSGSLGTHLLTLPDALLANAVGLEAVGGCSVALRAQAGRSSLLMKSAAICCITGGNHQYAHTHRVWPHVLSCMCEEPFQRTRLLG